MNMSEALQAVWNQPETLAARPVTWKEMGVGILRISEMFVIVTKDGLALAPIPGDETFKEWETVSTDVLDAEVEIIHAAEKLVNHGKETPVVDETVQPLGDSPHP